MAAPAPPVGKRTGPAAAWVAGFGTLGVVLVYLGLIAAQGGVGDGDGGRVLLVSASLLASAAACVTAARSARRRQAVTLLCLAVLPLAGWGLLAIFSIGVLLLPLAAITTIAAIQTHQDVRATDGVRYRTGT